MAVLKIYCEETSGLETINALIQYSSSDIIIYTRKDAIATFRGALGGSIEYVAIEDLTGNSRWVSYLDFIFRLFFTNKEFSALYSRLYDSMLGKIGWWGIVVAWLNRKVNISTQVSSRVYSLLFRQVNRFRGAKKRLSGNVVALSRVNFPYIFCDDGVEVYMVLESWDHMVKSPFLFSPVCVYSWNRGLSEVVCQLQCVDRTREIFPLKFSYLVEKHGKDRIYDFCYALYISSTSSVNGALFDEEKRVIVSLSRQLIKFGLVLVVKPHPFGADKDYEDISSTENLVIGVNRGKVGRYYYFTKSDNEYRVALLEGADFVINIATTFVLESALVGVNVLQLEVVDDSRCPLLLDFQKNDHLQKYILNREGVFTLSERVVEKFMGSDKIEFSKSLSKWLSDGRTLSHELLVRSVQSLLKDVHDSKNT